MYNDGCVPHQQLRDTDTYISSASVRITVILLYNCNVCTFEK